MGLGGLVTSKLGGGADEGNPTVFAVPVWVGPAAFLHKAKKKRLQIPCLYRKGNLQIIGHMTKILQIPPSI